VVARANLPSGTAEYNLEEPWGKKNVRLLLIFFLCDFCACAPERWNPEVVNIFGAAARYRRATFGSSLDDVHPDNSRKHRVKFTLFCCTSANLFFSCCDSVEAPRQRLGHHD
jgi:hypothetical protein